MKTPQRVFSKPGQASYVDAIWFDHIRRNNAVILKNGENLSDYSDSAVAFETQNFG